MKPDSRPDLPGTKADPLQKARERLILALDFHASSACFAFLDRLNEATPSDAGPRWVKVGLELFLAEGPAVVSRLTAAGYKVFLDLKLHDIPNTVAGAVRSLASLEPALLTVHAAGGAAMLTAAAEAAAGSGTRLLAVTVLTSMDAVQLAAVGVADSPAEQVARLAAMAETSGIGGLVCSAQEASALRSARPAMHLVTPGIRPTGAELGDQQRVSTPRQALLDGADQLVVGRPITAADDPSVAYLAILEQIAGTTL